MANPHYERVLTELSRVLGFTDTHALATGGRIKAGDHIITFIHDEEIDQHHVSVYVDLGKPSSHEKRAFELLLKINFELDASGRGTLSLHPETGHAFYSFKYPLNDVASGQSLLDNLARAVADVAVEGAAAAA